MRLADGRGLWANRLQIFLATARTPMNEHVQAAKIEPPLFNPLAPEFIRDPYPSYERLRTSDPLHLTLGMFAATRHAEARLALPDNRFFTHYAAPTIPR